MSDAKYYEYYPRDTDEFPGFDFRPCLKCGAMIHAAYLGLHVEWHEKQGESCEKRYTAGLFSTLEEAEAAVVALRNRLHTHNDTDRVTA